MKQGSQYILLTIVALAVSRAWLDVFTQVFEAQQSLKNLLIFAIVISLIGFILTEQYILDGEKPGSGKLVEREHHHYKTLSLKEHRQSWP